MNDQQEEYDVLIVGAGFAGLYQLYHLRRLGYKVKVVEAASGLGGIWYWTTYPGARVDSAVPVYELNIEELWKEWTYSERYPAQPEILKYFQYVDQKLDLSKDIYFNTCVVKAQFDLDNNKWQVHTEDGRVFTSRFLDLCIGFGAQPYYALFKAVKEYKGIISHSHNWPQQIDLHGKKVAVIGTGPTGVQIIQEIGAKVGHLTVFQRTPNLALPMLNPKLSAAEQSAEKEKYPELFNLRYNSFGGFLYTPREAKTFDEPAEARQAFYEQLWAHGDFHFWVASYADLLLNERANKEAYDFWCKKVRARLHDPSMQDKLAPLEPPHAFGTKRPSLEVSYYEVFNQPNVDLIDIRANPIDRFTPTGIRTKDKVDHDFDVVVVATGFNAVTGGLHRIDIKGSDGISLKDKWANGIKSYLGMTSSGFPNLFFIYNAHGPTLFANGPTCIEIQGDWVINCIDHMYKSRKERIDATKEAQEEWSKHVGELYNHTLFPKTENVYSGTNIPGKLKEAMCYVGGIPMYMKECKEAGYEGFTIV